MSAEEGDLVQGFVAQLGKAIALSLLVCCSLRSSIRSREPSAGTDRDEKCGHHESNTHGRVIQLNFLDIGEDGTARRNCRAATNDGEELGCPDVGEHCADHDHQKRNDGFAFDDDDEPDDHEEDCVDDLSAL
ncbi:unannotated protein [freshwater metagenome]|uniref:Unannotated protein n=1 Tax=freshwater metagenome TaxID=449393 RepID=A0A6J6MF67_9ZZZZ